MSQAFDRAWQTVSIILLQIVFLLYLIEFSSERIVLWKAIFLGLFISFLAYTFFFLICHGSQCDPFPPGLSLYVFKFASCRCPIGNQTHILSLSLFIYTSFHCFADTGPRAQQFVRNDVLVSQCFCPLRLVNVFLH